MSIKTLKLLSILALVSFLSACSSTGLLVLNGAVKAGKQQPVIKGISYGDDLWQTLDVYPNQKKQNAAPVVVFIYGGGWDSGQKSQYYFAANAFLNKGYTVVVPDYVKYPEGKFPTFIEDVAKALAWTKNNITQHNGDANNIFVVGHSAGAHTGALLVTDDGYLNQVGMRPSDIRAFAGMAGPYGFTPKELKYVKIFSPEENYPKMKAMNFVDGSEPPMLLMHGLGDKVVGVPNKDTLVAKLKDAGSDVGDIEYAGVSHVGILLKLHPWFAKKYDAASDIDAFFKARIVTQNTNSATIAY